MTLLENETSAATTAESESKMPRLAKCPTVELSSGYNMPMVGLGTWKSKPGEVRAAVEAAIDAGYRHIDCAKIYGNEKEVGEGLETKLSAGLPREELFIVSKLWNNAHRKEDVKDACLKQLEDLGLKYFDLYLIHWPHAFQPGGALIPRDEDGLVLYDEDTEFTDTWEAMEELVELGLVRSIGVSNFNARQIKELLEKCRIKPVTNQVERHPYFDQHRLMEVCTEAGIPLTAYCPLGSMDNPARREGDPVLLQDEVLIKIGEKYGKTSAQVAIRWQIQCGVFVIPKSVSPARIEQNFDVFDFELTPEDMEAVKGINRDWRCNEPVIVVDGVVKPRDAKHRLYPFNDEF